eukprot:7148315-Prymnesium_polylepis.1
MVPCARLQFFSHAARTIGLSTAYRAKGAKSGRPPHAPKAGVAVPGGPACASQPPCIMPPRFPPHERRIPHCPPSSTLKFSPSRRSCRSP